MRIIDISMFWVLKGFNEPLGLKNKASVEGPKTALPL